MNSIEHAHTGPASTRKITLPAQELGDRRLGDILYFRPEVPWLVSLKEASQHEDHGNSNPGQTIAMAIRQIEAMTGAPRVLAPFLSVHFALT